MERGMPGALGAGIGVLAAVNLLNNRIAPRAAVPTSIAGTVALLAISRRAGLSLRELGLARDEAARGLRYGAAVTGGVGLIYAAGAAAPATRPLFADRRAADTLPGLARQALLDVPFGTVLLEEVGFRGVLPALLARSYGDRVAHAASAVLFGLWHVPPSAGLLAGNPALAEASIAGARPSRARVAAGAVVTTALAGAGFAALRGRSASLVAPKVAHTATNSLGYLAAWLVGSPSGPSGAGGAAGVGVSPPGRRCTVGRRTRGPGPGSSGLVRPGLS